MANIYFENFEQVKKLTLKLDVWVGFWATYPCHPCTFYPIRTPFRRNSYEIPSAPVVTLLFSLTHVTCMALHHTMVLRYSTSVTLGAVMPCQLLPGNLPRVLGIWESVFYSQTFFTLHSFLLLQAFLRAEI